MRDSPVSVTAPQTKCCVCFVPLKIFLNYARGTIFRNIEISEYRAFGTLGRPLSHRHTALTFGKRTHALHVHRHPSRIHQSCFSHPEHPTHTSASPNDGVVHTGSTFLGVPHTGSTFLGVPHTMFTGALPMTSQQAISLLTPFVAKGEQGHPTRTRTQVYRVPNMLSDLRWQ